MIDGNEVCDDGNTNSGDGCSAECYKESGWQCGGGNNSIRDICALEPIVTYVSAASCAGHLVTITGKYFTGEDVQVRLGAQACGNVTVVSSSVILCVAPSGGGGGFDVGL